MEDQVMDGINIIMKAIFVIVVSFYCFYHSYQILVMGKEYITPPIRFRIFLINVFAGHSKAMKERQKYTSPEIVRQGGKILLVWGVLGMILAILLFISLYL